MLGMMEWNEDGMELGLLNRFSGSRVPGIGTGTDRVIEEPGTGSPVPVPVPVLMFLKSSGFGSTRNRPVLTRNRIINQF